MEAPNVNAPASLKEVQGMAYDVLRNFTALGVAPRAVAMV